MAELVDPEKLVAVTQVAHEYGYHPKYFTQLASAGKIKAWRIGNIWASTRENIEAYLQSAPSPGRPKSTSHKRHKNSTKNA